jgi:hypothetical protein
VFYLARVTPGAYERRNRRFPRLFQPFRFHQEEFALAKTQEGL